MAYFDETFNDILPSQMNALNLAQDTNVASSSISFDDVDDDGLEFTEQQDLPECACKFDADDECVDE